MLFVNFIQQWDGVIAGRCPDSEYAHLHPTQPRAPGIWGLRKANEEYISNPKPYYEVKSIPGIVTPGARRQWSV